MKKACKKQDYKYNMLNIYISRCFKERVKCKMYLVIVVLSHLKFEKKILKHFL